MHANRHVRSALVAMGLVSLLFTDIELAMAQAVAEEEVIVTARRREESFQDVPVTITAFTEDDIDTAGIGEPQDFVGLTPNVTLVETQNQGTNFLTIRGVSQARNSEPSAAIIVDGVMLTNPAQLTQDLFDVQSIEVLKGPQGAIFGRNAIGGAILITTKEPGEDMEGRVRVGYDSGPGMRAQVQGSGPLGDSDTLKYHAALSYYDTDGWIDNVYLGDEADPYKDTSVRLRLIGDPSDRLRWDARYYQSQVETRSLFYRIDSRDDVNIANIPVRVNNPGRNDRDLSQLSFKLDYEMDAGTFTSITSFDSIEEILTGDQYDFVPEAESHFLSLSFFGFPFGNWDWAQAQYLDVDTVSQELRFTSPSDSNIRWIAGAYFTTTDRYISTGNIIDDPDDPSDNAYPVYRVPRDMATYPDSFQLTYLADGQDNFAWAVFGEIVTDIAERTELSIALRYDKDERENTTLTPTAYLPPALVGAETGQVRKKTWDELQPRLTLRYQPSDTLTLFGSWSRGFRSGGFNQTGVGVDAAASAVGVVDLFDAEVADTLEFGLKSQLANNRVNFNLSVFDTNAEGSYFFLFLPFSSTQNLGSLGEVQYQGFEFDVSTRIGDYFDLAVAYGNTDSEIKRDSPFKTPYDPMDPSTVPSAVGNQAPLVVEDTLNVTGQYRRPLGSTGLSLLLRGDYQRMGDTWWDPANTTVRNPVNLLDLRVGIEGDTWSIIGWQKNVNDVAWNTEWSPGPPPPIGVGGFLWPATGKRWGVDFTKYF